MVQKIFRRREVEALTGKKRSTLYDAISKGDFPRPVKIGARAVGWMEADIAEWQAARMAERGDQAEIAA
jgi:prophage regulatory protein